MRQVAPLRLHALRVAYLFTAAFLALQVWPGIIAGDRDWEPLAGIAVSLYAALSVLCVLGIRNPLAMLPLLLLQLSYKAIWLAAVWLPLRLAGRADELHIEGFDLFLPFLVVVVLDLAVIPWPYVLGWFVTDPGDKGGEPTESLQPTKPGSTSLAPS